ncbi:hypothetical protein L211DRAFT_842774 [Terfezia boudieri ATCC MYA-4762]|uniref:Uncharacterized protein n=1 Tax=Terfezia boudieri ATCC MYA-4762 TaxID=1051890 RepID=A0A3N4L9L2_9PEZI|nr:hypothetical protein L211DRAFT_842774 [Terfezia boudieri ATCC MYA-4762]
MLLTSLYLPPLLLTPPHLLLSPLHFLLTPLHFLLTPPHLLLTHPYLVQYDLVYLKFFSELELLSEAGSESIDNNEEPSSESFDKYRKTG